MNGPRVSQLVSGSGLSIYALGAFGSNRSGVEPLLTRAAWLIGLAGPMLLLRAEWRRRVCGAQQR